MPPVAKKIKIQIEKNKNVSDVDKKEIKVEKVVSAQLQKKLNRRAKNRNKRPERGVVLIRHLPHGFFEEQLKQYFEQFGSVTRLRLARSRKTGGSKGFAFVEFAIPDVAQIAAKTMDNYLMFKKIVHAHYIPPEEQKYNFFKSKVKKVTTPLGKEIYVSGKTKLARYKVKQNNKWNQYNYEKRTSNCLKKMNMLKEKYADLGFDFDDVTIAPTLLPFKVDVDKKIENDDETVNTSQEQSDDNEPGSLLLIKKRKRNSNLTENVKVPKLTVSKDKNELLQLLDKTLEEESSSEDEDYIPIDSDEETLKLLNKSNAIPTEEKLKNDLLKKLNGIGGEKIKQNLLKKLNEIAAEDDDESDEYDIDFSDEETDNDVISSDDNAEDKEEKLKKRYIKSEKIAKPEKVSRLEKIIRRRPNLGGIKKTKNKILKSKSAKKTTATVAKDKMKRTAAKEIVKSTKIQTLKKVDLKKKKMKQK